MVEGLPVAEQRFTAKGAKQYILRYLYDENNSPIGFGIYYPTASSPYWQYYYFGKNLQGDVVALYRCDYKSSDKSYYPTLVATYTYDPWGAPTGIYDANGNTISQTSHAVAAYNPFRYRGYRYDGDTRLYYLQSRYYDPVVGRFVNADRYASTGQGFIGHNMFAYCGNDAVNFMDPTGNCYYNSKGKWCHDNWEYIGNYQRKPEPATFLGKTPNGRNLYIGKNSNYSTTPNSIKAIDYRTNSDPNIQIYNSYKVTEPLDQIYVLHKLLEYNEETPTTPAWNRTFHSL